MVPILTLNPCPFCGGRNLLYDHMGPAYWVCCKECGTLGPSADTRVDARVKWNRRARPEAEEEVVVQ